MKAANDFLQVQVESKPRGFVVVDSSLLEGTVISAGGDQHLWSKKGIRVLFPANHGKVMKHSIGGVEYYFVDKSVVLAYE